MSIAAVARQQKTTNQTFVVARLFMFEYESKGPNKSPRQVDFYLNNTKYHQPPQKYFDISVCHKNV